MKRLSKTVRLGMLALAILLAAVLTVAPVLADYTENAPTPADGVQRARLAAASTGTTSIYVMTLPRSGDANPNNWGSKQVNLLNGWEHGASAYYAAKSLGSYSGPAVYCIEPGRPLRGQNDFTSPDETFWAQYPSGLNGAISGTVIQTLLGRIFMYGYTGNNSLDFNTANEADRQAIANQIATQLLVWETVVGERDAQFQHNDPSTQGKDAVMDMLNLNHPLYADITQHYQRIVSQVVAQSIQLPSFAASTPGSAQLHKVKWDEQTVKLTLSDTNASAGLFEYASSNPNITVTATGSGITLTISGPIPQEAIITVSRIANQRRGVVIWGDDWADDWAADKGVDWIATTGSPQRLAGYDEFESDELVGYVKVITSYITGDNDMPMLWLSLALMSLVGIAAVGLLSRKRYE
ncbi:hypothetical protein FACS1894184_04840 [Clostridia bacterium]|nr:hypothetical protein FACS1894184_04840 [Clostridia bacterium]